MRAVSNELRQVFRAYTKQLRSDVKAERGDKYRPQRIRGFEKVEISEEAKALSAAANSEEVEAKSDTKTTTNEMSAQARTNASTEEEASTEADVVLEKPEEQSDPVRQPE